jgi:rubrerythrin
MPSIKGTRTEKNLLAAFAGESQARNRYGFAAKVAKKEGYEQIAAIFLETDSSVSLKAAWSKSPPHTRPA